MSTVAALWRHPIKSHGREALETVHLNAGETMPGDRVWAVAHGSSSADNSAWSPCAAFTIGSKAPGLMAIDAQYDDAAGTVTLTHPKLGALTVDPDTQGDQLVGWTLPLQPANRAQSARVVRVPGRGMTDTPFPSVSIGNLSTHRTIEQKIGFPLSPKRWRLNIWLDGLAPWEEFEWIDREITIGGARLRVVERIERCMATTADPASGERNADTLGTLESWGHRDMGVYAEVLEGGDVALGDTARLV